MPKSAAKTASQDKSLVGDGRAEPTSQPLPLEHVAIIMDGNRRWADVRKFPRFLGHKEGVKSLKRLVRHVGALGLKYLTDMRSPAKTGNAARKRLTTYSSCSPTC